MGCFSWKYANTDNKRRLRIGSPAYLMCPDGTVIREPSYEGYGRFGGRDVYELVADWNREYLSKHPEFRIYSETLGYKPIGDFFWYPAYADLAKTPEDIEREAVDPEFGHNVQYRQIGIEIACTNVRNSMLPYPIKICSSPRCPKYDELPYSDKDPDQGF